MFVENYSDLINDKLDKTQCEMRKLGLSCLEIALNAVRPEKLVEDSVKIEDDLLFIMNEKYELKEFDKIYIIGGGKATAEMGFVLENIIKKSTNLDYCGIINIQEGLEISNSNQSSKIEINYASHPLPNENGIIGTQKMMELIQGATEQSLIFCLISGGGSALMPLPKSDLSLTELQETNSLLLASGASIHEINTIRKHLSDFKGGNLARRVYNTSKATLISLIISDVIGNSLDSIASGPTVPDSTIFRDAYDILLTYKLLEKIPNSIKLIIEAGLNGIIEENPKENDNCFKNTHNYLIGSVISAAKEIIAFLKKENYDIDYFSSSISGEAKIYARTLYSIINQKLDETRKDKKLALIGTGELTVTIKGGGIGGRNQEMLLSLLEIIMQEKVNYDFLVLAVNLDGIEGNSNAMGAIIDNHVLDQLKSRSLDPKTYLMNNDSNSFFKLLNCEILTGPTGCNVNDLILVLINQY